MEDLIIYDTLDSTNKEAHRLLASGPVINYLTLWAKHQTEGRGQYGRTWMAEPGSHLAMTIIYQPGTLNPSELPLLSMKVSLGIILAIKHLDPDLLPQIKWPNDIYVDGKKLCGILIENSLSGNKVQHSIIGIGLNVNESSFPPEIPNATSLHVLTGKDYPLFHVLNVIRSFIITTINEDSPAWKTEYDDFVFGKYEWFPFEMEGKIIRAEVLGVSMEGKLMLRTDDRKVNSYFSHEVKWMGKG